VNLPVVAVALLVPLLGGASACKKKDGGDAPAATGAAPTVIRVTGIPDENPTELARNYQPMVDLLEQALGTDVVYVPVTDYGAAVQALVAGKVDFAWLGGFTHVQARTMTEVVPVCMRDIDREFHSVFIANTASGVTDVAGLRGKKFAFGSKSSTSGHLMPRHFLASQFQLDPDKDFDGAPVFSGAHDATAKIVESGKVAGGALNEQVWQRMVDEKTIDTSRVSVIFTTPPYVDYVWTARAAVPEQTRAKFARAFLTLDATNPAHQQVLERMGATKYVAASPTDFDAIEGVARQVGMLAQ
jgi:phosphonate transport system substrate-binding protein